MFEVNNGILRASRNLKCQPAQSLWQDAVVKWVVSAGVVYCSVFAYLQEVFQDFLCFWTKLSTYGFELRHGFLNPSQLPIPDFGSLLIHRFRGLVRCCLH